MRWHSFRDLSVRFAHPEARGPTCEGRRSFRECFSRSDTVFVITSSRPGRVVRSGQCEPLCLTFREYSRPSDALFVNSPFLGCRLKGLNALLVGSSGESPAERQMVPLRVQAQP